VGMIGEAKLGGQRGQVTCAVDEAVQHPHQP
jgi:hypothetical protein